ncbi:class I SAM-dependent methyltransferase [Streptomyces lavendulae]|uniref:class I SAM-dependent methyltransferase n=1 Tax=Streptomyces lavendulae TaxID=1914 RepID=UPI0036E1EE5B
MSASSQWDRYASLTPAGRQGPPPAFSWTIHPGHGPGAELLELAAGQTVLELGCGKGDRLAAVSALGVRAVGVDISPVQVAAAACRWGPAIEVHQADAAHFLHHRPDEYDAVFSVFGAHWFTDPTRLLPAIRQRLRPGGVLVLAHLSPGEQFDAHGPTAARVPSETVLRWEGEADQWVNVLAACGFSAPLGCAISPPDGATDCTVVLRAWAG